MLVMVVLLEAINGKQLTQYLCCFNILCFNHYPLTRLNLSKQPLHACIYHSCNHLWNRIKENGADFTTPLIKWMVCVAQPHQKYGYRTPLSCQPKNHNCPIFFSILWFSSQVPPASSRPIMTLDKRQDVENPCMSFYPTSSSFFKLLSFKRK